MVTGNNQGNLWNIVYEVLMTQEDHQKYYRSSETKGNRTIKVDFLRPV